MNIEFNNQTENEVEYVEKDDHSTSLRYKKFEILIFLGCLLLAFMIWCYANYLDDPIIQREVPLIITVDGEEIIRDKIVIYGEQSVISGVYEIKNNVTADQFSKGNTSLTMKIDFPDGVHSHEDTVQIQLQDNSK